MNREWLIEFVMQEVKDSWGKVDDCNCWICPSPTDGHPLEENTRWTCGPSNDDDVPVNHWEHSSILDTSESDDDANEASSGESSTPASEAEAFDANASTESEAFHCMLPSSHPTDPELIEAWSPLLWQIRNFYVRKREEEWKRIVGISVDEGMEAGVIHPTPLTRCGPRTGVPLGAKQKKAISILYLVNKQWFNIGISIAWKSCELVDLLRHVHGTPQQVRLSSCSLNFDMCL